ncbi:MAG: tetratricopeptide repeat protein [Solirubrobacterales bacterium]
MNREKIETLLQRADDLAGRPTFGRVTAGVIRQRVHHRQVIRITVPLTAAAAVAITAAVWTLSVKTQEAVPQPEPQKIASLEAQVRQLQERTDATLQLVQQVLEQDRRHRRVAAAEAELASVPDPMRQVEQQVDKAAFVLIYQADRLYKELNQTESAVAAYKEIIQLFPTNRWAEVARERLAEIEKHTSDQIGS